MLCSFHRVDFQTQQVHNTHEDTLTQAQEQSRRLKDAVAAIFAVNGECSALLERCMRTEIVVLTSQCVRAAFSFSSYSIVMFFFPLLAPIIRLIALAFPDKGLIKQKYNRKVIVDTVSFLIEQHRAVLASEVSHSAFHTCC
jgi:hypothetical protein